MFCSRRLDYSLVAWLRYPDLFSHNLHSPRFLGGKGVQAPCNQKLPSSFDEAYDTSQFLHRSG